MVRIITLLLTLTSTVTAFQSPPRPGDCTDSNQCRQLALAAAERGDYEAFHDLAWRAVQTGRPRDTALMYLLARAQSLSGRPHDALIMLGRLADLGVGSDAATNDDFRRVRQLPDWPELDARISSLSRPDAAAVAVVVAPPVVNAAPAPAVNAPAPPAAKSPARPEPSPAATVGVRLPSVALGPPASQIRFSTKQFPVAGLAYDRLSQRFVVGDRLGRRLIIVDERSSQAMDLVRADSAGFLDIAAVEIDARRGDLWVVSSQNGGGMLHRLQLVSGRPLRSYAVATDREPVRLTDLTIMANGSIVVLDAMNAQLFTLRPGDTALQPAMKIDVESPLSLAAGTDDGVVFVAHPTGVSRIDLRTRTIARLAPPKGASLDGIEQLRRSRSALIAVRRDDQGTRQVVRLDMNARGTAITGATNLTVSVPAADTFFTVTGDDLLSLTEAGDNGNSAADRQFVASRIPLR